MSAPSLDHRAWVAKAENDFFTTETMMATGRVPWDIVSFHAQQGAEKYLKAFSRYHGPEPPRLHDLPALLQACMNIDPTLAALEPDCLLLMPYMSSRYPGALLDPGRNEGERLVSAANRIRDAITRHLPGAQP